MADRNRFEALEDNIEVLIELCREAGIVVCDYQPSISLHRKVNDLVVRLQDLERMQNDVQDVHVPIELFHKIDAGQNPQLYTREFMEQALAKNEAVRGKLDSLKRFRALLMGELSRHFPNEMAKYRAVRGDPESPVVVSATAASTSFIATGTVTMTSSTPHSTGSGTETGPDSSSFR